MLAAGAYSFRQQSRLAISLSWIGGYVNVVALLATAHVVSHTTGNVTSFAQSLVERQWTQTALLGSLLACFLFGAIISAALTEGSRRHKARSTYIFAIVTEAMLLLVLAILLHIQHRTDVQGNNFLLMMGCVGSAAMGLQNATITRISSSVVRTTHLTGVFTDVGIECVRMFLWWKDRFHRPLPRRARRLFRVMIRQRVFLRLALLASIIGSFALGALAGTWAYLHHPAWTMYVPVVFLLWLVLMQWRTPVADVKIFDPHRERDFLMADSLENLLPPGIAIYRLRINSGRHHRAPDFQKWAEDLPAHWRIIVLVFTPMTILTTNAAVDLKMAIESLRKHNRHLILTSLTREQIHTLRTAGVGKVISRYDLCDSLPKALTRAVEIHKTIWSPSSATAPGPAAAAAPAQEASPPQASS